jgi:hypothetical protein
VKKFAGLKGRCGFRQAAARQGLEEGIHTTTDRLMMDKTAGAGRRVNVEIVESGMSSPASAEIQI